KKEVEAGRFREDLYYRLAVVELVVPPLRERAGDVPLLVEHFRRKYADRFELGEVRFTPALVEALSQRSWPGNVRELENAVARLLALSDGATLDVDALALLGADAGSASGAGEGLREQVAAFEKRLVEQAMHKTGGNQSEAARVLGISRVTLIDKLKRYGLHPADRDGREGQAQRAPGGVEP
ncbi:MAG: helix-turn-helix domain-containing protein, partial [Myxococcales bacterium]